MKKVKISTKEEATRSINGYNRYSILVENDHTILCPSGMVVSKEKCDMCSQCRPRH